MTETRLTIFILAYALISVQRVPGLPLNRPAASLLGAVAMVTIGGMPLAEAYTAIDADIVVFLLGLMIVVAYLEEASSSSGSRSGWSSARPRRGSCWRR